MLNKGRVDVAPGGGRVFGGRRAANLDNCAKDKVVQCLARNLMERQSLGRGSKRYIITLTIKRTWILLFRRGKQLASVTSQSI